MKQRALPFLLVPFFCVFAAQAATWKEFDRYPKAGKNAVRLEADTDTLTASSANKVRLWLREHHPTSVMTESGGFSYQRRTSLLEMDCKARKVTVQERRYFSASGAERKLEKPENIESQNVAPDSVFEKTLNYACALGLKPTDPPGLPPPPKVEEPPKKEAPPRKKGARPIEPPLPPLPPPEWSYGGENGPDKWGDLGSDYALCKTGEQQSPINIRQTVLAELPPLAFAYQEAAPTLTNNGHAISVRLPQAGEVTINGEAFALQRLEFHAPSEEKLKGKSYPMSVHFMHQAEDGRLAVIAVLIKEIKGKNAKEQEVIRALWPLIPLEEKKPVSPENVKIDAAKLLPTRREYYTFVGSLTSPPCTEGVLWVVLKSPIELTSRQIGSFTTIYKNNARPVQTVNGRVIKESKNFPKPKITKTRK